MLSFCAEQLTHSHPAEQKNAASDEPRFKCHHRRGTELLNELAQSRVLIALRVVLTEAKYLRPNIALTVQ
jgi:hypothetical protein